MQYLRKVLASWFGIVYTKGEVIHLVNCFLEDVRTKRLDVNELRDAPDRDRWCLHLAVAFEKYYMSERSSVRRQNDSAHPAKECKTDG